MPAFQIIFGRKDEPKEDWDRYAKSSVWNSEKQVYVNEYIFDTPQEANEIVRKLNDSEKRYGHGDIAYMLQRLPDPVDFVARECARTDYTPFEIQGKDFHCAELKDEGISYYATKYDAYDDKRTIMKLGRYLKAHTDKDDNEISAICASHGVEFGDSACKWARTRDEIADVYERGPQSCMKGSRRNWFCYNGVYIHPAEVYASGDIAIAYLERDGRITARTVVNMLNKTYLTIYGDSVRLHRLLEAEGYTHDNATLDGCRILKIDVDEGYACPFLDDGNVSAAIIDDDDEHLLLNKERGAFGGEEGYITHASASCPHQEYGQDEDYDYDY